MSLKKYAVHKTDDGLIIEGVEIFKLNNDRGFPYDKDWFAKAQANHQAAREAGFLPSVIVGHNSPFSNREKASIAFFDNVRLDKDEVTVLADYLLDTDGMLKVFSAYPHRSVEVYPDDAFFSAVAQLGGTEPHFKLPPLKFGKFQPLQHAQGSTPHYFSANAKPEVINFDGEAGMSLEEIVARDQKQRELSDLEWAAMQKVWDIQDDETLDAAAKIAAIAKVWQEWAEAALKKTEEIVNIEDKSTSTDQMAATKPATVAPDGSPLGTPNPGDPDRAKFQAERDQFLAEKRAFQNQKINEQFEKLHAAGLAKPLLDKFRALRESLLDGQALPSVQFKANGSANAAIPLDKFCDDLFADITTRLQNQTFAAPIQPAQTGIKPVLPTYQESGAVADDRSDVRDKILAYMAEKGYKEGQYQKAWNEMKKLGLL